MRRTDCFKLVLIDAKSPVKNENKINTIEIEFANVVDDGNSSAEYGCVAAKHNVQFAAV